MGIYLCDLGVAKILPSNALSLRTSHNQEAGTPSYMAPELYTPSRRGTPVDIYSFGCLLIELFGGKRVWAGLSSAEIMQKVCGCYEQPPCGPSVQHLEHKYQLHTV